MYVGVENLKDMVVFIKHKKLHSGSFTCVCGSNVERCDQYDACYCISSGEWVEEECGDDRCSFCKDRPKTYLEVKKKERFNMKMTKEELLKQLAYVMGQLDAIVCIDADEVHEVIADAARRNLETLYKSVLQDGVDINDK